jgi:hypothetical protein
LLAFCGEDFGRCRSIGGNKPTAKRNRTMEALLFSPRPRHAPGATACSSRAFFCRILVSADAEGIGDMRQLRLLLRSAPWRIGRRLALIAAIAAASLPAAGA